VIITIRYGGQGEVEKDGKKLTIPIPPPVVLNQMGAFIKVTMVLMVQSLFVIETHLRQTLPWRVLKCSGALRAISAGIIVTRDTFKYIY
jgi:hypothetical protein